MIDCRSDNMSFFVGCLMGGAVGVLTLLFMQGINNNRKRKVKGAI